MKYTRPIYDVLAMSKGIVRSLRCFSSIEFIALNFSKINTLLAGITSVKMKITEINQNLMELGKTIG